MARIIDMEDYRRLPMPRRASSGARSAVPKDKGRKTRRVQMSTAGFEAWKRWCAVMGMTREQSVLFLIKRHPPDTKKVATDLSDLVSQAEEEARARERSGEVDEESEE